MNGDGHGDEGFQTEELSDHEFYEIITRDGRLPDLEKAHLVTGHIFSSLAVGLDRRLVEELQRCLPPGPARQLNEAIDQSPREAAVDYDTQQFVGPLVNAMDTVSQYDQTLGGMDLVSSYMDDDAAMQTQAVFKAVRRCCGPELAQAMEDALPVEVTDWFRDSGVNPS